MTGSPEGEPISSSLPTRPRLELESPVIGVVTEILAAKRSGRRSGKASRSSKTEAVEGCADSRIRDDKRNEGRR
jgi:hypothetical protein